MTPPVQTATSSAGELRTIGEIADAILANVATETDAERADRERRDGESAERVRQAECLTRWRTLVGQFGRRYEQARLSNFEATCEQQLTVVRQLTEFVAGIGEAITAGRNVVLYGPRGTGKDHLLVALLRAAIGSGHTVAWRDGQTLYSECRDAIGREDSEAKFFGQFTGPNVFAISDPTPPIGDVKSDWQLATLFRIVDRRYRDLKPTWVTINATNAEEAMRRIAPNIIDRLTHGALVLKCNWQSYRSGK